jgi:hypothetical protein
MVEGVDEGPRRGEQDKKQKEQEDRYKEADLAALGHGLVESSECALSTAAQANKLSAGVRDEGAADPFEGKDGTVKKARYY